MDNKRLFTRLRRAARSRKGVTLVEMICAVTILALVVVAVMGVLSLSRTTILKDNTQDAASAQAQEVMDVLMASLSDLPNASPADVEADLLALDAVYAPSTAGFAAKNGAKQYTFARTLPDAHGIYGYNIYVAVFYSGDSSVTLNSFVPYQGGTAP